MESYAPIATSRVFCVGAETVGASGILARVYFVAPVKEAVSRASPFLDFPRNVYCVFGDSPLNV